MRSGVTISVAAYVWCTMSYERGGQQAQRIKSPLRLSTLLLGKAGLWTAAVCEMQMQVTRAK